MLSLYVAICRRWGPRGLTISAYAWVIAQETGNTRLRNFIDGLWLVFRNKAQHCQAHWQRHFRQSAVARSTPKERT